MNLIQAVESLNKRPLAAEEVAQLAELQRIYAIDDDDPLIVVLALMARSQLLVQTVPDLLQQKVEDTIELHRSLLRDQSVVIAKELISTLAQQIKDAGKQEADRDWKIRWTRYFALFAGGALIMFLLLRVFH